MAMAKTDDDTTKPSDVRTFTMESKSWFTGLGGAFGGSRKRGDLFVAGPVAAALAALHEKIAGDRQKNSSDQQIWDFAATPFAACACTREDILVAFLKWSQKDDDKAATPPRFNISSAFRRARAYGELMERNRAALTEPPLAWTPAMAALCDDMGLTADAAVTEDGRLLVTMDAPKIKAGGVQRRIKEGKRDGQAANALLVLRMTCLLSHKWMLHAAQQDRGILFLEDLSATGVLTMASVMKLHGKRKKDLQKMSQGSMPVKMTSIVAVNPPRWIGWFMKIAKLFMSKKLRSRINLRWTPKKKGKVVNEAGQAWDDVLAEMVDSDLDIAKGKLPAGFGGVGTGTSCFSFFPPDGDGGEDAAGGGGGGGGGPERAPATPPPLPLVPPPQPPANVPAESPPPPAAAAANGTSEHNTTTSTPGGDNREKEFFAKMKEQGADQKQKAERAEAARLAAMTDEEKAAHEAEVAAARKRAATKDKVLKTQVGKIGAVKGTKAKILATKSKKKKKAKRKKQAAEQESAS